MPGRCDSAGVVTVRRDALAVILPIVDIGLAQSDIDALADLEDAIAQLRAALADDGGYRPLSIFAGQDTGGG